MNDLQIFEKPEFGSIRTTEKDGKVLFCGSDVAKALGYANPRDALARHCKVDGVVKHDVVSETVNQYGVATQQNVTMSFITEGNVYRLITHSKLPAAEQFEHWVFDEVLPTIRKTGTYTKPTATTPEIAQTRAAAMMLNAKSRIANQMMKLWTAAGVEPQYQALAMNNYYDGLSVPRIALKAEATAMYDLTTIAKHLGVMSTSGKPHAQAIGAIVEKLKPLDEGEYELTPFSRNGHDDVSMQYTLSVEHKIKTWLEDNLYPNSITGKGKSFTVKYKEVN